MWSIIRNTPHKAKALFLVGVIYVFLAAANFSTYAELKNGKSDRRYYAAQFSLFNDLRVWACFFGLAGVVAMVCAVTRRYYAGFFGAMLMAVWWACLFVASFAINGYGRIWPSILMWSLISMFLYIIAAWPEVPELPKEVN